MPLHSIRVVGPSADGSRISGPLMRDILAMVAEGSRRALRMRVEGRSTAAGWIPDRLEPATEFDFLGLLSPYLSPSGQTARGQSSSGCPCSQAAGRGVSISMAAVGRPEGNGFAERLMRTIKEEEVDLSEYQDFGDALRQLGRFLDDVCNRKRIHSSLGYLTPSEFEQQWLNGQAIVAV